MFGDMDRILKCITLVYHDRKNGSLASVHFAFVEGGKGPCALVVAVVQLWYLNGLSVIPD